MTDIPPPIAPLPPGALLLWPNDDGTRSSYRVNADGRVVAWEPTITARLTWTDDGEIRVEEETDD